MQDRGRAVPGHLASERAGPRICQICGDGLADALKSGWSDRSRAPLEPEAKDCAADGGGSAYPGTPEGVLRALGERSVSSESPMCSRSHNSPNVRKPL